MANKLNGIITGRKENKEIKDIQRKFIFNEITVNPKMIVDLKIGFTFIKRKMKYKYVALKICVNRRLRRFTVPSGTN